MLTQYALGQYSAVPAAHALHVPYGYKHDGQTPAVLWAHGAGQQPYMHLDTGFAADKGVAAALGERWPVFIGSFGYDAFGNDQFISEVTAARSFVGSWLNVFPAGVYLCGVSMGGTVLNWARQNLAAVRAVALFVTPPDFEDARATNRQSLQAPIEAAYGGNANWQAARPTHNPIEFADELSVPPIGCWYGTADPVVFPGEVEAFAQASGAELHPLEGGDHATAFQLIDPDEVIEFFEAA
jgi:hypothetical protein